MNMVRHNAITEENNLITLPSVFHAIDYCPGNLCIHEKRFLIGSADGYKINVIPGGVVASIKVHPFSRSIIHNIDVALSSSGPLGDRTLQKPKIATSFVGSGPRFYLFFLVRVREGYINKTKFKQYYD
jgi:hypothetical protein